MKNQNETVQYESTSECRNKRCNKSRQKSPLSVKISRCQLCHAGGEKDCAGKYLKALDNIVPTLESINILSLDHNHLSC